MPAGPSLDGLLASVSRGESVDWDALEREAPDAEARELLQRLREVAQLADDQRRRLTYDELEAPIDACPDDRRWGRFTLREKLGEGSFGAVYRAWDPQLERDIAIKLIHPHVALRDAPGTRLLREGRAAARVKHENVVTVLGVETHDEHVGLCMEYVQGDTMEELVRVGGPMSPRDAAEVGCRVASALAAVHAADLVHRDVKARNVMRETATGRVVLMDFGSGLKLEPGLDGGVPIAGTPLYMAPEVLVGDLPSSRSDVYGVGVLLYFLVSGEFPVDGRSLDEIRDAHASGRRVFLTERRPDVPVAFARVVERALDTNPVNRHSNATSLLRDLELAVGRPREVLSGPPSLARALVAYARRHAADVAATAVASTLVVWALGFLSTRTYHRVLGIEGAFVTDTAASWLRWGAKGLVAPIVGGASAMAFLLVTIELLRLARKVSPRLDDWWFDLARRLHTIVHRTGYSLIDALSLATLAASVLSLAVLYFGVFADLLSAVGASVVSLSDAQLRRLGPAFRAEHQLYREVFTVVGVGMLAAWLGVWRTARRRGERVRPGFTALGVLSLVVAFMLLDHPYRILWHNKAERVGYGAERCYLVAEASGRAQLFCPTSAPRRRIVELSDPSLVRSGEIENVFTPLVGS